METNNPAVRHYRTQNRLVDTLKCRDNTNARSRWPYRCVGSPCVRPRSLRRCKTIWSLLSLRGSIAADPTDRSAIRRCRVATSAPKTAGMQAAKRLHRPLRWHLLPFSTHRCHLGRGSPTKRAQPDGDGSISRFTGRAFGKAVIHQQMSTGSCSSARVSKNKRVFNKRERKHTTTRKEGPS